MITIAQANNAKIGDVVYVMVIVRRWTVDQESYSLAKIVGENLHRKDGVPEWEIVLVGGDNTSLFVPKNEVFR